MIAYLLEGDEVVGVETLLENEESPVKVVKCLRKL